MAKIEPGERLLVHSAAGGVGTALLQLGRIAGCPTLAVVGSAAKAPLCRRLGAEAVIDRSAGTLWPDVDRHWPDGFDVALDANGVTTPRPAFERLRHGGRLVIYGFAEIFPRGSENPGALRLAANYLRVPRFSPMEMTAKNRGVLGFNVVFLFHRFALAERAIGQLLKWIEEGKLQKTPVSAFPLEEAARAHAALESGATMGKLVLTA